MSLEDDKENVCEISFHVLRLIIISVYDLLSTTSNLTTTDVQVHQACLREFKAFE